MIPFRRRTLAALIVLGAVTGGASQRAIED